MSLSTRDKTNLRDEYRLRDCTFCGDGTCINNRFKEENDRILWSCVISCSISPLDKSEIFFFLPRTLHIAYVHNKTINLNIDTSIINVRKNIYSTVFLYQCTCVRSKTVFELTIIKTTICENVYLLDKMYKKNIKASYVYIIFRYTNF